ncbi:MAG: hypothetical protein AAB839_00270 [Patescibacteria group bacterium]
MKVVYDKSVMPNPLAVLRKAGYSPFTDPNTGISSFELRPTSTPYPRFHLYVAGKGDEVTFNLHLDQKKPSYGVGHAHSGEYEGSTIEREMRRIDSWVRHVETEEEVRVEGKGQRSKPWWKMW